MGTRGVLLWWVMPCKSHNMDIFKVHALQAPVYGHLQIGSLEMAYLWVF